tara:strand:- start:182 stop:430 length:249 start_codon:yes stop_codon:yes gene_type:complete
MSDKKYPDFEVFHIIKKNPEDKGFWKSVGSAWKHRDGVGISLYLDYLPLKTDSEGRTNLVLREYNPDRFKGDKKPDTENDFG